MKLSYCLSITTGLFLLGSLNTQAACGQASSTITNLPSLDNAGYQVYGLNATGQITGTFYVAFEHAPQAFVYDSGMVTNLGTFGGDTSAGYVINSAGQVAGQADLTGNTQTHALLFAGGLVQDLQTLGGTFSTARAINDAGVVAGSSLLADNATTLAFVYTNGGTLFPLGSLGGNYSEAFALNNSGVVAGESAIPSGDTHGFVYSNGVMADVGTLGGTYSTIYALSDSGVAVGISALPDWSMHGFAYSAGTITDVGTLGGSFSVAFGVNRSGQVIGDATTTGEAEFHGFFYEGGAITDLGTLGGNYSYADAINNLGQVVGEAGTVDGVSHAFLWQKGQMLDLNTVLPANSGWELNSGLFINDAGRIVGVGTLNGLPQWFIMDLSTGNKAPVAVAGSDQVVDCQTQVILNGSASSDPDGDTLSFQWTLQGVPLGTTPILSVYLPVGTNVITLTVSDPCGAAAQTNLSVVVRDSTAPVVSGPAPLTIAVDAHCQAVVPNVLPNVSATDNCTAAKELVLSQDPAAGTVVGSGQYTIVASAKDEAGNVGTASVILNVVDNTAPAIGQLPGPITLSADAHCQAVVPNVLSGVIASDNCTPANQLALSQSPLAGTVVGSGQYTIVVAAKDLAGNMATGNVILNVVDTTSPTILEVPNPITLSVDAHCQAVVPNVLSSVVASDNCTPANQLVLTQDPAAGTIVGTGSYLIKVTVMDAAGNTTSGNVALTVVDKTPPAIQSLTASPSVISPPNHAMIPVTVAISVSDNCDPSPASKIISITADGPLAAGEVQITGPLTARLAASKNSSGTTRIYTITVQATDAAGNSSLGSVLVTVPASNGNGNGNGNSNRKP